MATSLFTGTFPIPPSDKIHKASQALLALLLTLTFLLSGSFKSHAQAFTVPLCSTTLQITQGPSAIICTPASACSWSWSGPGLSFSCTNCQIPTITAPAPGVYLATVNFSGQSNGSITYSISFGYVDADNDLFNRCEDCNDNNALERPGQLWYRDFDNDGYAPNLTFTIQCQRPAGHKAIQELIAVTADCNDNNAAIRPGAAEVCDGIDNNCAGGIDEGVLITYYRDQDGDGFGNPAVTQLGCSQPGGYVTNNTDCVDNSAVQRPGQTWYKDTDNDGYGAMGVASVVQCLRPAGYKAASELTATATDCNDNSALERPGQQWYRDNDNDGYAQTGSVVSQCSRPAGYKHSSELTSTTGDCNDNDAGIRPGVTDILCNNIDEDCSGTPAADNAPPTAVCKNITVTLVNNSATITASQIDNGSSDNCSSVTLSANPTNFNCSHLGQTIPVVLTVTDGNNNTATCTANVTVTGTFVNTIYVKYNATGANNGASWTDAYSDLQTALAAACSGTQIWVAAGTYKPTSGTDKNSAFNMKNEVALYGGFPGIPGQEGNFAVRNWTAHVTVLSGDLLGDDGTNFANYNDNSFNVITSTGLNNTAGLNGFTIRGGNAQGPGLQTYGGGMRNEASSPVVENCTFEHNIATLGGAVSNRNGSSPVLHNCVFSGNNGYNSGATANAGGAMYFLSNSNATISNCQFLGNSAPGSSGGALNIIGSSPVLTNCTFYNNTASAQGAAVYTAFNGLTNPVFNNCTFSGNSSGSVIRNGLGVNLYVNNCILWGNNGGINNTGNGIVTVSHSIVQGDFAGNNNLNADPLFVNAAGGDLRLQGCSPAVNAGNNASVPGGITSDLDGNSRFYNNGTVDMGAYEFQGLRPNPTPVCQNITVQLGVDNTVTVLAVQLNNGSTGCGNLSYLINGQASLAFDCDDLDTPQNVTLTVTDTYNGTATCQAVITVADDINPCCAAPEAVCKPFTAVLNGAQVVVTPADVNNGSTAECGLQSITVSPNTFNCSQVGLQTVTLTVTDINGESDACQAIVTVVDQTLPTITCPATQTLVLGANCGATLPNYTSLATTGDNCGVQSVTQSPVAGTTVSGAGNMTVTLTVTDVNNLATSCTFTVTKVDNTPPTITCPATQTVVLGANCGATLANYMSLATIGDNCGVQSVTQSPAAGTPVSGAGNMTVTLTVTDVNNLTTSCTFTVTKVDNTPPTITCPTTQTVVLGANCSATLPNYTSLATTGDNCGVQSVTQSPVAGTTVSGAGNITVTLTVTDVNNLTTSCTFTVNKVDNTPPTITCPATQTLVLGANCGATLPNYTSLATTGDNCGVQSVTQSPVAGTTVSGAGNITVTLTVTDINSTPSQCTFTVTKVDQTPPTPVCKNTTVFIGNTGTYTFQPADVFNATASSDNCSGELIVTNISPAMVSCAELNQTIPVTVTVEDASGNMATCTAQITVQEGSVLPVGWNSADVGTANGGAGYKACSFNGSFTVAANGFSTSSADVLHFASRQLCGNGEIIARVMNVSGGGWAGVMLRESLAPGSKKVTLKTQLTSIIRREIRSVANGATSMLNLNRPQHVWLRLVRNGSNFIGYTSVNGSNWDFAFSATVSMAGCIYAGVFAESINTNTTTTASFSNVSIIGSQNNLVANPSGGIEDLDGILPSLEVNIFPNPTSGGVNLDFANAPTGLLNIQVFNTLGERILLKETDGVGMTTERLDLSDLADGVYFITVQAAGYAPLTKRIVLAKAERLRP